jgi:hypothetical protein
MSSAVFPASLFTVNVLLISPKEISSVASLVSALGKVAVSQGLTHCHKIKQRYAKIQGIVLQVNDC